MFAKKNQVDQDSARKNTSALMIEIDEEERLYTMTIFERKYRDKGCKIIAGIDEAGRGPLAGPVVAAACIVPESLFFPGINDSKQLTAKKRASLFEEITNHPEVVYGVGFASSETIDQINIYQATIQAMLMALANLSIQPDIILVDGMKLENPLSIPYEKIVQGDAKSQSIAAASIIAKETRDRWMEEYDLQWPQYGFKKHKGYGTAKHLDALELYGPCPIHRTSFAPVAEAKLLVRNLEGH